MQQAEMRRRSTRALSIAVFAGLATIAACGGGQRGGAPSGSVPAQEPILPTATGRVPRQPDVVALYRRMGLLADAGETPFVGSLSFFGGPTADSTSIVVTVSLANRALRFRSEGDRWRATYDVAIEVRSGTTVVQDLRAREVVRVLAFRETTRDDESVLFRQIVNLTPGTYDIRLTVRDEAATRGSAVEATIGVPRFAEGSVSSPVPVYEARPREQLGAPLDIVPTPRSTAVFGRDSVMMIYAEGYGEGSSIPVRVSVKSDESNTILWSDSLQFPRHGDHFSSTFAIPLSRLGVGVMLLGVNRPGSPDTLRIPIFVAFGEDLPVATFTQMLDYLRYYVSAQRLQAMRDAPPESRASVWAAFLRDTDPVAQTPAHEGLRDYFSRIAQANTRFREEGQAGWLTDRGRVVVALGQPDQIYEPTMSDIGQRGRTLVWEYREHRLQVVFVDQTGFGRWRMTLPSESEFESTVRRIILQ
ncbi:MAG TPA: GWxTD domain-containing protein [Gemmatimonadaceae bacterium]